MNQRQRRKFSNEFKAKYEHIYLHVYQTGNELWGGLDSYFQFYNKDRLHQNLNYKTPCQYYSKAARKTNTKIFFNLK
ncbi:MAG: integrase core domain-containing protein [Prevotellaceae bacterium]|jgi:transposase InsO family protein|nr:integrase core domain-containing protein [Prevotellaceae bacterium]